MINSSHSISSKAGRQQEQAIGGPAPWFFVPSLSMLKLVDDLAERLR